MKITNIYGPPGTGKTTYLMNILTKELETVTPEQIAFVSFTRTGANEGINRATDVTGLPKNRFVFFRTLHSLAFKMLSLSKTKTVDRHHYKEFSQATNMNFVGYYTEDLKHSDDRYLFLHNLRKNNPETAKIYIDELEVTKAQWISRQYENYKHFYGIFDYTDMIEKFIEVAAKVPVKVAIIDEAQDLTTLQWRMVWTAFRDCERIYIAGDDDQAIYEWSGADIDAILNLHGKNTVLHKSYRLPEAVLQYAKKLSARISKRVEKDFDSTGKQGTVENIVSLEQLNNITDNSKTWLLLSRNNSLLKKYEKFLQSIPIVYRKKGALSICEKEVRAIKSYNALQEGKDIDPIDTANMLQHIEIGDLKRSWYEAVNWSNAKKEYYINLFDSDAIQFNTHIDVNTIHSVKGSEADNVVLMSEITRQVYKNLQLAPDSEHRVFYVGATRAKENLYLLQNSGRYGYPL